MEVHDGVEIPTNIYEEDIYTPPSMDERGNPLNVDILEGIDLDKDLEDLEAYKQQDNRKVFDRSSRDCPLSPGNPNIVSIPMSNDPDDILQVNVKPGGLLQRNIEDPTENDDLFSSIKNNDATSTILNYIMVEIAEEAAYLKTWRRENFNLKEDLSEISNKRILILKKLVDTIEKREKISNSKSTGKVDFHSENFQKVFSHFLHVVKDTFTEVNIPAQYEDIFFSQLAKALDGFEDTAEKIYHGKKVKK
jgi:hypothetical protein